jgi:hypothetical protein
MKMRLMGLEVVDIMLEGRTKMMEVYDRTRMLKCYDLIPWMESLGYLDDFSDVHIAYL